MFFRLEGKREEVHACGGAGAYRLECLDLVEPGSFLGCEAIMTVEGKLSLQEGGIGVVQGLKVGGVGVELTVGGTLDGPRQILDRVIEIQSDVLSFAA